MISRSAGAGTTQAGGYISDEALFHFVGRSLATDDERYTLLTRGILRQRQLRHPPFTQGGSLYGYSIRTAEDGTWIGSLEAEKQGEPPGELLFPNIICFADIPLRHLALHMGKYSRFGLAFSKEFLSRRGARPVMYFPYVREAVALAGIHGRAALLELTNRFKELAEGRYDADEPLKRDMLLQFLAYVKPYDVTLPPDHPENYYTEREWRKIGYLDFAWQDILHLLVPAAFEARVKAEFPDLAGRVLVV